ncbi:MAG TPA: hypothetical protein VI643_05505, partial [Planctomycetota bacterium]|nr:hypothetical protein [Planctomycetota bacterium]
MKTEDGRRKTKGASALLFALTCGLLALAQDAPQKQDPAIERVIARIQNIEKDSKAKPNEEPPGGHPQGHFWGGKYYDSSMIILPRDERVIQGLDRLTAFVRSGLWSDAGRNLQEMMETFPTQILQLKSDPSLFVGVKAWCEETIRTSPELLR